MDNDQLVNVIKTLKKTELVFGSNNCKLRVGKSDVKIEDQEGDELISIYPQIREREYRVLYSSPTLDKHGTSTAQELVDFWEANDFFFDDIGSQSGGYVSVEFRANLPTTIGTPVLGDVYLVEKPTTILFGTYTTYQSGLYIKDSDTGSLNDWRRLNVKTNFTDSEFAVVDTLDPSKRLKFIVSLFTSSTTRFFTWPNKDGTVAMLSDVKISEKFVSSDQIIISSGLLTIAHGLTSTPNIIVAELICLVAELGFSVGDIVSISFASAEKERGITVLPDSTNLVIRYGKNGDVFNILDFTEGKSQNLTNENWSLRMTAYA